ncbi:NADH-quinone oxidoreductase subunit E [Aliiroseovarius sp. S1123]|jgi:NADH-quinone oxidoreductase subunit E|uniref:NADH-quinone oxidoreductase subunit E n=1 Tax=unclassified Aliiroseovarius TaxID=2623558 RepID=UPI001FF2B05F|nr:NADH-quinone oxidoreductase subunit E [Aliiroseovarius sp. S1123]MCK0170017.1 NADH-quinone oxidoreductase subunit E [Aliiroseovarius sp. S1123]
MLRRLHHEQPESFAFTPANLAWAEGQITKYPEGRQASAVIPLLWRAQEQEGWLTKPAIEAVADMLGMAYIRVLEVASFYFMFQLQPVGSVAHIQICGTTGCMICGAEDLIAVCREKIADKPHVVSGDGKLSWEEVECLGSCTNAPMAQIGKDYYEDLTAESFAKIVDELRAGNVPTPGPQNGRYAAEPLSGLTSLTEYDSGKTQYNASVQLATDIGDTVKRIDGTEVPLLTPWIGKDGIVAGRNAAAPTPKAPATGKTAAQQAKPAAKKAEPKKAEKAEAAPAATGTAMKPRTLKAPRKSGADDLKQLKGVGPKLEQTLNELGFWHFDQIAKWGADEIAWVDDNLKFKGRIERDGWIEQAKTLAEGGETEFSSKVKKGKVY